MFLRLKVSDAAAKIPTSPTPAACARSSPVRLGTSAAYRVPGAREMPANTSAASAICGTHFGLTNADTSIAGRRAAVNRSTNSILFAVLIVAGSFWSPSRGPTSTIVTREGSVTGPVYALEAGSGKRPLTHGRAEGAGSG